MNQTANHFSAKEILFNPIHFFAFGFGSGLAPKAPGTFGTLMAVPIYCLLSNLPFVFYLVACALVIVIGIWLCDKSSELLNVHDHPGIVWDEFAGFFITMIAIEPSLINIALGFVLFRIFDIVKPWPIKVVDKRVEGGLGIMLDDVIAGIFSWACLFGIQYFFGNEYLFGNKYFWS